MKISERGRITIPKSLREKYGLKKNVEVALLPSEKGILIQKRSLNLHPVDRIFGILDKPSDTDMYIEKIRGR